MSLEEDTKLWNKFGSAGEVTNSEIGQNCAIVGTPTYESGKFGDGARSDSILNQINVPDTDFGPNQFLLAIWCKPIGWSITDGAASVNSHSILNWRVSTIHRGYWYFNNSGFRGVWRGGVSGDFNVTDPSFDVADGELFHLIIVMNRTGIAGTANTVRVYFNGNLVYTSNTVYGALVGSANWEFFVRTDINGNYFDPFVGVLDNPKVTFDTSQATIDAVIANMNTEGFPLLPITTQNMTKEGQSQINPNTGAIYHNKVIVSSGTYSDAYLIPKTSITGLAVYVEGDGKVLLTNDIDSVIASGLADWVEWDGATPINRGYTAFRIKRISGTVTAKLTVRARS